MTEFKDLSPEQQAVVEDWGRGLAVMAGAGCGKTTTLVIKCHELLKRNPEARFAAVSFTERSASDLRTKCSARMPLRNHWVMTIHGLCAAVIREFPREAGFDGEETMLSEGESQLLWDEAQNPLWIGDDLPGIIDGALERLLARESRDSLMGLLRRAKDLSSFGLLESLREAGDADAKALETVARYVLERYQRFKRRRGALDFNDLEKGADRALEDRVVRARFHDRFDLVLVDEFQDTNPLQARILARFGKPDFSNICVVGDPKQSIYRFRDADVTVFEEFCGRLPARKSLTWNFRSRAGIIEYTNRVCEPAFAATRMLYEPLVAKREAPANPLVAESGQVLHLEVDSPAQLGAFIRAEMERGVPLDEMALLLRRIRGNESWLKALSAAGIPVAVGSGGLFWEDPRVRELVAFLKWWENPGNSLSGAVFLRAPWVGMEDRILDEWVREDATWQEPFFRSDHPLARALAPYRAAAGKVRPGELLLALLISPEIENELGAPLLGLWHRVEDLSFRGADFHSVVSELVSALQENRREREVPPPRNLGQLSVLTLHGAKGLEFPHVILVDFQEKPKTADTPLLFWDREQGAFLGGRDEEGDRTHNSDPLEGTWKAKEHAKNVAESMRVLYVALTRARERLIVVLPRLSKPLDEKAMAKPYGKDHWRAWIEHSGASANVASGVADSGGAAGQKYFNGVTSGVPSADVPVEIVRSAWAGSVRQVRPRHSVTELNLLSRCPRAYEWTHIRPVSIPAVDEPESLEGDEGRRSAFSQRELGTKVHAALELFEGSASRGVEELRRIEGEAGESRFRADALIAWAGRSPEMKPADPGCGREVWRELSFEVPISGEILVGSIDRLVRESVDGVSRFTLVDFKITTARKSPRSLLENYQTQLELYAAALGALEPQTKIQQMNALLVNISPGHVEAVPVPLGGLRVEELVREAAHIVSGNPGIARPGAMCRYCPVRGLCREA
ncbi:MAG: hypothetical protein A2428_05710 [Bdellovibrionales bacterium RIFOXYC1_FULL_54_43]|nr:MAG: hypothetical protein A2428_05710 [Bdellovibrionales bacterium RIFOXYC1_FULL_54_43]OFZ80818.1 MAG: hypothetical protein A2603_03590 [Bdellovibrionales bacterium RIFOXYD1_FULL_55_31]